MVKIYIDNKTYHVDEANNLLQTCLSLGIDIPYFCWHPLLGSIGSCRQCAVIKYNDFNDAHGRLIMSCMTPVTDGDIISINNNTESKLFRSSIIELLLTNHPHDCPVCEEGGHCHLQDMTVMTKHHQRNFRFKKRTHKNQYLGSFIKHEMNRCISCYRCVRYYNNYADGTDFGVYGVNNNIYFGRIEDGCLENEHSGNLIELCPTGVFVDKTHSQKYNRKWDMQYAPGICHNCSVGCNISIGERYGEIRRIENRYHASINHYLICDLGRFGYSHLNLTTRPKTPIYVNKNSSNILDFKTGVEVSSIFFKKYNRVVGIGSSRSSIENNFALQELVGYNNFCHGMSEKEENCVKLILDTLKHTNIYTPTLKEIEEYDVILVLGEDLTQTSPRVALAIRQAMKKKAYDLANLYKIPKWHSAPISHLAETFKNHLYIMHTHETKLDDISEWSYFGTINEQVVLSCAIAYELDNTLPQVKNLSTVLKEKALFIANSLLMSEKCLIISGSHSFNSSIIQSAINLAKSIKQNNINHHVGLTFLTSSANTLGLGLMGGISIDSMIEKFKNKKFDAAIFMEYDLYRCISKHDCDVVFKKQDNIITLDHQYTHTYQKSRLKLPSTNFTETSGTIVNFEGRAQRFFQVYDPMFYDNNHCLYDSWKWLHAIKAKINKKKTYWFNLDDVMNACIQKYPIFQQISINEPDSNFRIYDHKIARSPIRSSGRTALRANIDIHEPEQPKDKNTMFAFSMEGYNQPNQSIPHIPFAWFPGWNSPQAWNKFQTKIGEKLVSKDSGTHLFKNHHIIQNTSLKIIDPVCMTDKAWKIIPYYHIFGNEELTQYSSIIQENIPLPYALISLVDAVKLGLHKDSIVEFNCLNENYRLRIRLSKYLHKKQIGLPIGRKGFPIALVGQKINCLQEFIR